MNTSIACADDVVLTMLSRLLQMGLAAIATDRGVRIFRKRSAIKALGSVPLGAPLLLLALILNASAALCNASELVMWMCLQQRSVDGLNLFTKADVAAPLLTGAAAVASQAFMVNSLLTLICGI